MNSTTAIWQRPLLLSHGQSGAALAERVLALWALRSDLPQLLQCVSADDLPAALQAHGHRSPWVLLLTESASDRAALAASRAVQAASCPAVIALDLGDSLWALDRSHSLLSPCLACLQAQPELLPQPHPEGAALSLDAKSHALLGHVAQLPQSAPGNWTLRPLLSPRIESPCLVLKDPLCAHCSAHATRPNEVYYFQESIHE